MTTIIEFITARLDEDEETAKTATEGPWASVGYDADGWAVVALPEGNRKVISRSGSDDADHIAMHDPAYVLADIESKRRILARHQNCGRGHGYCDDGGHGWEDDAGARCADLCDLAEPYAYHPDYDESWRP